MYFTWTQNDCEMFGDASITADFQEGRGIIPSEILTICSYISRQFHRTDTVLDLNFQNSNKVDPDPLIMNSRPVPH